MPAHKTFFGRIFGGLWDFIKDAFNSANHHYLEIAIDVTNTIKNALKSGLADIITNLIPGNIDNDIVIFLRAKLPLILADELLLKSVVENPTEADAQQLSEDILNAFGGLSDDRKEQFYTSIAAKIYIFLQQHKNSEKVTFGQAAAFVESAYQAYLKSKEDPNV